MVRKKGFYILILVLTAAAVSATAFAAGNVGFYDVAESAWYADAVEYVNENGIMSGISNDRFFPDSPMTRGMLATVLYRMAGSPAVYGTDDFSDTEEGAWYSDGVVWASQGGLISGYGSGRFGTNDPVTREQIAAILWRQSGSPQAAGAGFADEGDISAWASDAVDWARSQDIISGMSGNRFAPKSSATRAQAASILMNYSNKQPEPETQPPAVTPGDDQQTESKILIAYFSATGNTESVAQHLDSILNADVYEIMPAQEYTSDDLNYNDSGSRVSREHGDPDFRPEIAGGIDNMQDYDVVFLGYPIWWGQAPNIISTFLESYDFSGKLIVPFCTSASSGIGSSADNLHSLVQDADWNAGRRFGSSVSLSDVENWVSELRLPRSISQNDTLKTNVLNININGRTLIAELADNSSAQALKELLADGPVTINMNDYGGMEKVGEIGTTLPTNDEYINTAAGDLILYQGSKFVIYYESNSWNLTRLGRINNIYADDLRTLLGSGNVTATLSMEG